MESSDLDKGMAEAVAPEMPSPATIAACKWLPDDELRVSSTECGRTMFQGGLNADSSIGQQKATLGQLHQHDLADDPARPQARSRIEDGFQKRRRGDLAFHEQAGLSASHQCHSRVGGLRAINEV